MGWHEHHAFRMDVEVLSVKGLPDNKKKFSFKVSTSRDESKFLADDIKNFSGLTSLNVRMADSHVKFEVYEKGSKEKNDYGELDLDVDHLLQTHSTLPILNKQVPLVRKDGKHGAVVTCNIFISCDTSTRPGLVGVLSQAAKKTKERSEKTGKRLKTDVTRMGYLERIRFVSRALDGPLFKSGFGGIEKLVWLRVQETSNGKFELHVFPWKAVGGIPVEGGPQPSDKPDFKCQVLSISAIVSNQEFPEAFSIKIVEKAPGSKEDAPGKVTVLEFRKSEMPRDHWVEGFYDFLQRLRTFKKAKRDGTLEDLDAEYEIECENLIEQQSKSPIYSGVDLAAKRAQANAHQLKVQAKKAEMKEQKGEYSDEEGSEFSENDQLLDTNKPNKYFAAPQKASSKKLASDSMRQRKNQEEAPLDIGDEVLRGVEAADKATNDRLKRILSSAPEQKIDFKNGRGAKSAISATTVPSTAVNQQNQKLKRQQTYEESLVDSIFEDYNGSDDEDTTEQGTDEELL